MQTSESLRENVYNAFIHYFGDTNYVSNFLIVEGLNRTHREANRKTSKKLPGKVIEYKSHDECIDDEHRAIFDSDYLNRIESSRLKSHNITLKRHTLILIILNLHVIGGHYNGTKYVFS